MADAVSITGLSEFRAALKAMDRDLPKALRLAFNTAAEIVVADARPRVPSRSGKARGSVKARSTQAYSRVSGGGSRAPYYPWLDFGGTIEPRRGQFIRRPFLKKEGRYIYAAYFSNRDRYGTVLQDALVKVAEQAGIEVE